MRFCGRASRRTGSGGLQCSVTWRSGQDRGPLPSARHVPLVPRGPASRLWRRRLPVAWYLYLPHERQ